MNSYLKQMRHAPTVLVVDDDPAMRLAVTESLKRLGYATQTATSGEEALAHLSERPVDTILTDMQMNGMNGVDLFHEVNKKTNVPVIIMSAYGTIDTAVTAMKSGIVDYLVKPFSQDRLEEAMKKSFTQNGSEGEKPEARMTRGRSVSSQRVILTKDAGMLRLLKMAEVVAGSDATIFVEGESGTGKEVLARFVHQHSPRAHRPFIAINCAAVPENLLESELFGYEKGAFTGATVRKPGKFELAHTGTLLLDEISEMQLSLQAKLLRVLQEKEVDSVGGKEPIPLDIRVIATTNRPILKEVEAGRFREDLYYRLNVFPLRIPPLRDRMTDIPLLAEYFCEKIAHRGNTQAKGLTPEAVSWLLTQPWRGNVRELENIMERAVLLAGSDAMIHLDHLHVPDVTASPTTPPTQPVKASKPALTLWEVEHDLIMETLHKMSGNRTHAAKQLGISLRTLRNKLKEYRSLSGGAGGGEETPEEEYIQDEAEVRGEVGSFCPAA